MVFDSIFDIEFRFCSSVMSLMSVDSSCKSMHCHLSFLFFSFETNETLITMFVNVEFFRHFETVTNIRTWTKSHRYWRML